MAELVRTILKKEEEEHGFEVRQRWVTSSYFTAPLPDLEEPLHLSQGLFPHLRKLSPTWWLYLKELMG